MRNRLVARRPRHTCKRSGAERAKRLRYGVGRHGFGVAPGAGGSAGGGPRRNGGKPVTTPRVTARIAFDRGDWADYGRPPTRREEARTCHDRNSAPSAYARIAAPNIMT